MGKTYILAEFAQNWNYIAMFGGRVFQQSAL